VASHFVDAARKPYVDALAGRSKKRAVPGEGTSRPVRVPASPGSNGHWRERYARRLWLSDLAVLALVVFGTQIAWFGLDRSDVVIREDSIFVGASYWAFSAGLVIAWMWSLSLIDSRSARIVGSGSSEYVRIISVSTRLFGIIAMLAFLLRVDLARGYLLISFPLGVALLLIERWAWRRWLIARRESGEWSATVLLVGSSESVAQIAAALRRTPSAGYHVVGACIPEGAAGDVVPGTEIPVYGDIRGVLGVLDAVGADTVAVTSTDELPPSGVKRISWALEADRRHLILAPSIADVVGPRIHTRPVAGLPLIHVETPRYSKGQRFLKRTADISVSAVALLLLAPLMAVLAMIVSSNSPGSVLFRQTRIGLDGRAFQMLKFRTMVPDAEALLSGLESGRDVGNEVLFKMVDDPRVTGIGRFLRKYSLDELPQLLNVLTGSMSLVGPRPPLPREVARYADHVHRRFMVKPGITGLWQVSGRSSLSWEESVRLDLSYVDNWTLAGDFVIMLRTARAALIPGKTAA
jgi:exopolysaccharide biosynthesis polyprenyl glycosylphosphotransferase